MRTNKVLLAVHYIVTIGIRHLSMTMILVPNSLF